MVRPFTVEKANSQDRLLGVLPEHDAPPDVFRMNLVEKSADQFLIFVGIRRGNFGPLDLAEKVEPQFSAFNRAVIRSCCDAPTSTPP